MGSFEKFSRHDQFKDENNCFDHVFLSHQRSFRTQLLEELISEFFEDLSFILLSKGSHCKSHVTKVIAYVTQFFAFKIIQGAFDHQRQGEEQRTGE
jgi:hypothetical protein